MRAVARHQEHQQVEQRAQDDAGWHDHRQHATSSVQQVSSVCCRTVGDESKKSIFAVLGYPGLAQRIHLLEFDFGRPDLSGGQQPQRGHRSGCAEHRPESTATSVLGCERL